ncbi:hypothetical protein A6E15_19420 [Natrinema saccharevitans]|uniref:PIN domain-containing protein n=1 Tax=Natrinema saccharevitans TaxID=301967 RepID=A0A1S8AQX7_9EURY|nr:hypothetical protein [Natrinema saccharevitans]OLZ39135.1 hypothetical protein A6E15_19420 [Natrinema saccharevitans]
MLILDSNVWIHAVIFGGKSRSLVEQIIKNGRKSAVNAYIHEEVRCNIDDDHSIDRSVRNRALEQFFAAIGNSPQIRNPDSETVERMDLEAERKKAHHKVIGAFGDIQAKDAPILTLAYQFLSYQPTIYTNDSEFADLSPTSRGIPEISIQYCDLEWGRAEQAVE